MAKKKAQSADSERKAQRETLEVLREELADLHEISLVVMAETGILPPLYGGEQLGTDREVIPLWGADEDDPELGALLLRVQPGVEPNTDLEAMRDELGMSNDWPISELLETLTTPDGHSLVEGAEEIDRLSMLFVLLDNQIGPAPGYDFETMLEAIGGAQPFAVFPIIPVSEDDERYDWDNLAGFRAEVVYAETPELLQAAVWEYRLNHALREEVQVIEAEGTDPDDELLARDTAGLSALFELLALRGLRLYGVTSPVRSRQQELDILREENDDLIVRAPLKPEIEPIPLLADDRRQVEGNDDGVIFHLEGKNLASRTIWPQVRAHKYFCIRFHQGVFRRGRGGRLQVTGFRSTPVMEWFMAEALPDLYRQVRLKAIYEMLRVARLVESTAEQMADSERTAT
jgi:hypothetical protein